MKLEVQERNWRESLVKMKGKDSERVGKAFRPRGKCDHKGGEREGKNI